MTEALKSSDLTIANLNNVKWRMKNLYRIIDDSGKDILFVPRPVQLMVFERMWYRNVVLKSRKHGVTTLIDLMALDTALFQKNQKVQIISETMTGAQNIFRTIIKHAYDSLPVAVQELIPWETRSTKEMVLANGSVISVGTGSRGDTPTFLHVSEMGRIGARYPEKAREILTGSIQSVASGSEQMVWVESTAMGRQGVFKEMVDRATKLKMSRTKLSKLDMKLLFFAWYEKPENVLPDSDIAIPEQMQEYFAKIKVKLTDAQKRWYCTQYDILGPDMLAEHPSTPEEPFSVSLEGAYFAHQFRRIYMERRVCKLDIVPELPVHTSWDIGMHDYMAIWFWQVVDGWIHAVDYYENNDQGIEHYIRELDNRGYRYGVHYAPHDINVKEVGAGKTRLETAASLGLRFRPVSRVGRKMDSIEALRRMMDHMKFDETRCDVGITHLEQYRKKWNPLTGAWSDDPAKTGDDHGADAAQCFAMGYEGHWEDKPILGGAPKSAWCNGKWS